jgi:multiple sugar transport system ATP-binding protein
MDEPLSNLDAKLRVSMRAALNQLHERLGITTVYVTHDQVEAMTLGQRVCVLRDGKLQQVDTPQKLFESPVNLFVAGFIGSPAMNFATAELVSDASWARIPVTAGVTEELGSEVHVIFTIDAPPVDHPSISDAARGDGEEDEAVTALAGGKSLWTARVSSRSAAKPGASLELGIDTKRLHFFDPDTGLAIA